VVLFLLAAAWFSFWSMQRIPQYVLLHINGEWAVMLAGEKDINQVKLSDTFTVTDITPMSMNVSGYGTLQWNANRITVHRDGINLNEQRLVKSRRQTKAHAIFYTDGRITKGKLQ